MRKYTNVLYFLNGSIGDFFMVLSLLEELHKDAPYLRLYIVTPRNASLFRECLALYPFVTIVEAHRGNAFSLLPTFFFQRNCCVVPPTPGRHPLMLKLIARALSLRGVLVGFFDGSVVDRALYTHGVHYDITKPYYRTLRDVLVALGFKESDTLPTWQVAHEERVLTSLALSPKDYIVLHPFGSSAQRSILNDELVEIVRFLRVTFPAKHIVLTGTSAERDLVPSEVRADSVVAAGTLSLPEVATLLADCWLYVGVDTSVSHVAGMAGVRSLIVAHPGSSPNWLPYYNAHATILYQVAGDTSGVHEGKEYLLAHQNGRSRFLERVPLGVIKEFIARVD